MKALDGTFKKIKDFFMPEVDGVGTYDVSEPQEVDELENESLVTKRPRAAVTDVRVEEVRANGTTGTASYTTASSNTGSAKVALDRLQGNTANPFVMRPYSSVNKTENVQVQETQPKHRSQELSINVYAPKVFDDVRSIADDIRGLKATIVNYDNVDMDMQRRICDFMNGACYVLGGDVRRISSTMVLYVPAGVNIGEVTENSMFSMR